MPTTDWSCFLLTPQKPIISAPHMPARPPARIPTNRLPDVYAAINEISALINISPSRPIFITPVLSETTSPTEPKISGTLILMPAAKRGTKNAAVKISFILFLLLFPAGRLGLLT